MKSTTNQSDDTLAKDIKDAQTPESPFRWVMLALAWLLYLSFGIIAFSLPPLVTPIIEEIDITHAQMGIILGAWPLTYILVSAFAGTIVDRWGVRRSLFLGVMLIGLSGVLRYFASGFTFLFVCVAIFGLGGPLISIGAPKMISLWFRGKGRGTAVGMYSTGSWIGGVVALSTVNSIIMPFTGYSWRLVFVYFGLLAFIMGLLWLVLSKDVRIAKATAGDSMASVLTRLGSVRNVQIIIIIGFLSMAIAHGLIDWLPRVLETRGMPPATASLVSTIPILAGIPAVLVIPRLVAPHLRGRIVALTSTIVAITLLVIINMSGANLIAGLVFYGMSMQISSPLLILVLMDLPEVGSKYMGAAGGMYFCLSEVGGFAGPFLIGAIKDMSGSFLVGFFVLMGISLIRLVLALMVKLKQAPSGIYNLQEDVRI